MGFTVGYCLLWFVLSIIEETKRRWIYTTRTYEAHIVFDGAFERPDSPRNADSDDASASSSKLLRRQNRFVDQLLSLLGEDFTDMLAQSNHANCDVPRDLIADLLTSQQLTPYGLLLTVDLIPDAVKEIIMERVKADFYRLYRPAKGSDRYASTLEQLQSYFTPTFKLYVHLKVRPTAVFFPTLPFFHASMN